MKKEFDKYEYYSKAVQSPETDVVFLRNTYKEIRRKKPATLREDFCAAFAICCEWVKLDSKHVAHGVDLDNEPITYGATHYLSQLTSHQQKRVQIHHANVMDPHLPKVDLICAMNFSYFIFKKRQQMRDYMANCLRTLNKDGILIMDCFGGSKCQEANEEETIHRTFSYYWDQESFDPITNHALFKIHFKPKGGRKIKDVFTYDWRMWSIPELRELLEEVGFRNTSVYWEGTTKNGEGNGEFTRSEHGEECEAWIAYIVAEK